MRTFYPRKTLKVAASEPHPDGTEYKISVGDEDWGDGTFQEVVKVQMMYDGKVAGRMSPSYPVGSDDWLRVSGTIAELTGKDVYLVPTMLSETAIMEQLDEILGLTEEHSSSERMRYLNQRSGFISYKMVPIYDYMFCHLTDDVKVFCDYKPAEGKELCDKIIEILRELDTDDDFFPQSAIDAVEDIKETSITPDSF